MVYRITNFSGYARKPQDTAAHYRKTNEHIPENDDSFTDCKPVKNWRIRVAWINIKHWQRDW